ncbi:MAG: hypothetical protein M3Y74_10610 [Chloroflexota bacterium]|nr:hypothetical protein [Chloroflexota bacterium]
MSNRPLLMAAGEARVARSVAVRVRSPRHRGPTDAGHGRPDAPTRAAVDGDNTPARDQTDGATARSRLGRGDGIVIASIAGRVLRTDGRASARGAPTMRATLGQVACDRLRCLTGPVCGGRASPRGPIPRPLSRLGFVKK